MKTSDVFEWIARELEDRTDLQELESRGTVRLVLKAAGLDPQSLGIEGATLAVTRLLPAELTARGVADPQAVCAAIAERLATLTVDEKRADTPEDVFRRLGS